MKSLFKEYGMFIVYGILILVITLWFAENKIFSINNSYQLKVYGDSALRLNKKVRIY